MRTYDENEIADLNAEPWQIDLLKVNPEYAFWGPHEDYMWTKGDGWNSPQIINSWAEFGPWQLDDLNECVNFYFSVERDNKECPDCRGNGYHPDAQIVANTFYPHQCAEIGRPQSEAWHDKITQDEADALVAEGRSRGMATAAEINAAQHGRGLNSHDAINRWILIETRLKRLGLPKACPTCNGSGYVFTAEKAHVSLTLWWLHPHKGCSRGIEITRIEQSDLPNIKGFLQHAAERNATRFEKVGLID